MKYLNWVLNHLKKIFAHIIVEGAEDERTFIKKGDENEGLVRNFFK